MQTAKQKVESRKQPGEIKEGFHGPRKAEIGISLTTDEHRWTQMDTDKLPRPRATDY
jgi:hypothetical protein